MSEQPQTTSGAPTDPVLCKMECGFFGNAATAGCCSKCWRDQQKKKEVAETVSTDIKKIEPTMETPKHHVEVAAPIVDAPKDNDVNNETTKRKEMSGKKKKKKSYKNLMAGMLSCTPDRDVEKEKEALRKGVGGGTFSKIEKI